MEIEDWPLFKKEGKYFTADAKKIFAFMREATQGPNSQSSEETKDEKYYLLSRLVRILYIKK